MRRESFAVGLMIAAVLAVFAGPAVAGERIEEFLPEETFLYAGMANVSVGADAIFARVERIAKASGEQKPLFEELMRNLAQGLPNLAAPLPQSFGEAAERLGLDARGSAGVAFLDSPQMLDDGPAVLIIVPVRDRAAVEATILAFAPMLQKQTNRLCSKQLRQIRRVKKRWAKAHADADAAPTLDELYAFDCSLPRLRCPGGGEYIIGVPGEKPRCTLHERGAVTYEGALDRDALAQQQFGAVTLIGGREVAFAYAYTAEHMILSNHPDAVERAARAFAGQHPRCRVAEKADAPWTADLTAFLAFDRLTPLLMHEFTREFGRREERRNSPAYRRWQGLIRAPGPVRLDIQLLEDGLRLRAAAGLRTSAAVAPILATGPASMNTMRLAPPSAYGILATNLIRHALYVGGDLALLKEPEVGLVFKIFGTILGQEGVFALTPGFAATDGPIPHMLLLVEVRDPEAFPELENALVALLQKEMRSGVYSEIEIAGAPVRVFQNRPTGTREKDGPPFYWTLLGRHAVLATDRAALEKVIAAAQRPGGGAPVRGQNANLAVMVDFPALFRTIAAGEHEKRKRWHLRSCLRNMRRLEKQARQFQDANGRPANDVAEIRQFAQQRKKNKWTPTRCPSRGAYQFSPATGKATCPNHGTVAAPQEFDPPVRKDEKIAAAIGRELGATALRLWFEGDQLLIEAQLMRAEN